MNASTTRTRTGRDGRSKAGREFYDAPVQGANALQIGYADQDLDELDDIEIAVPEVFSPPAPRPRRRAQPATRPDVRPGSRPVGNPSTVAPPAPMALPRAPFLILVVVMVIVGVLGVLVLNTKINENSFVLDDLHAQQEALDLKEQQLSRDLEEAKSPGNLRAAAKRLGLVPSGRAAFITLPDGKIVGVPTPANAPASTSTDR